MASHSSVHIQYQRALHTRSPTSTVPNMFDVGKPQSCHRPFTFYAVLSERSCNGRDAIAITARATTIAPSSPCLADPTVPPRG